VHGPGNVELPCGSMSLTCYDDGDDDDGISNIYPCFLHEKHIILMTFYPPATL